MASSPARCALANKPGVGERRKVHRAQDRQDRVARLARHRKSMIEAAAAGAGRGDHQAVERLPAPLVLVESVADELPQESGALRIPESDHALGERGSREKRAVGTAIFQVRREVAHGGQSESRDRRAVCLVHHLVQSDIEPADPDAPSSRSARTARSRAAAGRAGPSIRERNVSVALACTGSAAQYSTANPAARGRLTGLDVVGAHVSHDRRDRNLEREACERPARRTASRGTPGRIHGRARNGRRDPSAPARGPAGRPRSSGPATDRGRG